MTLLAFGDIVQAKHVERGFRNAGIEVVLVWPIWDRRTREWLPNDPAHPGEVTYYLAIPARECA